MNYQIEDIIEVKKTPHSCDGCFFNSEEKLRDWCMMSVWDYHQLASRGLHPACRKASVIFKIKEK